MGLGRERQGRIPGYTKAASKRSVDTYSEPIASWMFLVVQGPKTGVYRAQNTAEKNDVLNVLGFLM